MPSEEIEHPEEQKPSLQNIQVKLSIADPYAAQKRYMMSKILNF